jgi:rod shape-determining protein MreD
VRALVSLVLTAVTVVVQLTIVDRIAFPGGGGPDLVLLLVAALALAGGPMAGVLTGFWAGLALDVAPPGSHFTGQDALVFCLVGYACGLLADEFSGDAEQGHSALYEIGVTAGGAICGEALVALLGVMLSDPQVRWSAITHVLPAAVAYDVLLCPFVLYAAAAGLRLVGVRREGGRPGWSPSQARTSGPATNQGAIRQLAGGSGPRREPQLKLGRPGVRPATFTSGGLAAGSTRVKFGGRRHEGVLGGSRLGVSGRGGAGRGGAGRGVSGQSGAGLGRSLLGGSVFSGSSSSLGGGQVFGRSAPLGRSSPFRHRSNPMRSAGGGLTGRAPRLSRGSTPKSPGRNWLRSASSGGGSSRGTFLRGASLRGASLRGASSRGAFTRGGLAGKRLGHKRLGHKGLGHKGRGLGGGSSLGHSSMGRRAFGRRGIGQPRVPRLSAQRRWAGRRRGRGSYR